QVLVRERLALVVADAEDEPFSAWPGDAGPQNAVAVVTRGLRCVAFNGGGDWRDHLAGPWARPGLAAVLADDDPAMVASVLARVHHDGAVGDLHELALVG